ncbi:MAG: hypothetical protein HY319_29895 [Armatimonadetes bacterium]|nr:hypothetical protein [Armatimonadota bacterium]
MKEEEARNLEALVLEMEATPEEAEQILAAARYLPCWDQEEPPPGLAERTMQAVERAGKEQASPGLLARIDTWIGRLVRFFEGQRPLAVGMAALMVGTFLLVAVMTPNILRSHAQGEVVFCRTNLKNINLALKTYTREQNRPPADLRSLVPYYLREIPQCPAAGRDTYSKGFQVDPGSGRYTIFCKGNHHAGAGLKEDLPRYSSERGPEGAPD